MYTLATKPTVFKLVLKSANFEVLSTLLFCTFEDEDGGPQPQDGEGGPRPQDGEDGPEDGAMIQLFQEQHEDFRYSHDLDCFSK